MRRSSSRPVQTLHLRWITLAFVAMLAGLGLPLARSGLPLGELTMLLVGPVALALVGLAWAVRRAQARTRAPLKW